MEDSEKLQQVKEILQKIRELTFDEDWDFHKLRGECRKPVKRDWALIQSLAAEGMRLIGENNED